VLIGKKLKIDFRESRTVIAAVLLGKLSGKQVGRPCSVHSARALQRLSKVI
jgi:hypothetical protein